MKPLLPYAYVALAHRGSDIPMYEHTFHIAHIYRPFNLPCFTHHTTPLISHVALSASHRPDTESHPIVHSGADAHSCCFHSVTAHEIRMSTRACCYDIL